MWCLGEVEGKADIILQPETQISSQVGGEEGGQQVLERWRKAPYVLAPALGGSKTLERNGCIVHLGRQPIGNLGKRFFCLENGVGASECRGTGTEDTSAVTCVD